ncbi:hypothetical protein [Streptomyces sp. NPDC012466]|uniref:hypothetical protein n=1 Tax=Streptomyces sp. NPDC012466 TaxID=3364835 RepID=UPI0036EE2259
MPEHEVVWQTRDRHHAKRRGSERCTDDRELLARLQDARFEGLLLEQLVNDLWQYGWRCLRRWMRDGTITAQCKTKGIPLTCFDNETTELQRSSELREDLAATAVGDAVRYFVETSLPCGYWKPHKGASMRTYFIHDCLYRFRNAFNEWARPRRRMMEALAQPYLDDDWPASAAAFEEQVALRDAVRLILRRSSAEGAAIVALMYQEQCTQKEIGVRLGLSVRSVEGHLRRVRLLARDMQRRGQIDVPFAVLDSKAGAR